VFTECLAGELVCGDQHRRTGSGSALEALRDDALYKYVFMFTLLTLNADTHFTIQQRIEG